MLNPKLLRLSSAAIVAASAIVLTALSTIGAPATTTPGFSHRVIAAENAGHATTAPHSRGVVHLVRRGLAKDCVNIQLLDNINYISGNGVNNPVRMEFTGNCFNLYNEFSVPYGTKAYTGYEYQNGDGHCLWDDGGTIELGAACKANHPNEEFFANTWNPGLGWTVSDVTEGPGQVMDVVSNCSSVINGEVGMVPANNSTGCLGYIYWNFP
jgi:hypothetical protein